MLSSRHASVALALLSALFLAAWFYTGQSVHTGIWPLAASALLATILLSLSYIDLRTLLLPDLLTLPLLALGLAWSAWQGVGWIQAFLGAVLGYGIVAGLDLFWRKFRGKEGIGLGDAKLLAAGGAWLGVYQLPMVLLVASGTGLAAILTIRALQKSGPDQPVVSFGPFLSLGIWICWCGAFATLVV